MEQYSPRQRHTRILKVLLQRSGAPGESRMLFLSPRAWGSTENVQPHARHSTTSPTLLETHLTGRRGCYFVCAQTAQLPSQSGRNELPALLLSISSFPHSQNAPPPNTWPWANLDATNRHAEHGISPEFRSHPRLTSSPCVEHFKELVSFFQLSTKLLTFHFSKKNSFDIFSYFNI